MRNAPVVGGSRNGKANEWEEWEYCRVDVGIKEIKDGIKGNRMEEGKKTEGEGVEMATATAIVRFRGSGRLLFFQRKGNGRRKMAKGEE